MNRFNQVYRESLSQSFGEFGPDDNFNASLNQYRKTIMTVKLSLWKMKETGKPQFEELPLTRDIKDTKLVNVDFENFYRECLKSEDEKILTDNKDNLQNKIKKYFSDSAPLGDKDPNVYLFWERYGVSLEPIRQQLWANMKPAVKSYFSMRHRIIFNNDFNTTVETNPLNADFKSNNEICVVYNPEIFTDSHMQEGSVIMGKVCYSKGYFLRTEKSNKDAIVVCTVVLEGVANLQSKQFKGLIPEADLKHALTVKWIKAGMSSVNDILPAVRHFNNGWDWEMIPLDLIMI